MKHADRFFEFACKRYAMLLRRQQGLAEYPWWTDDPILRAYRFCNIFREDDTVTQWMRENLTKPIGDDLEKQVRAAVVFRWFNKVETGHALRSFLHYDWDTERVRRTLNTIVAAGYPILGAAYMIKSPPGMNKVDGLLSCIDKVLAKLTSLTLTMVDDNSLQAAHEALLGFDYLGPFMAYQMVCDLRYSPVLDQASDIMTWVCPGPGSARGLGRVMYGDVGHFRYTNAAQQEEMLQGMRDLLVLSQDPVNWPVEWPSWELSTVQHVLCEADKYERVRLGEGTPKQLYKPAK